MYAMYAIKKTIYLKYQCGHSGNETLMLNAANDRNKVALRKWENFIF
jgi:hypothetical protein